MPFMCKYLLVFDVTLVAVLLLVLSYGDYICASGLFTAYQRTNFRFVFISQCLDISRDGIAHLNI